MFEVMAIPITSSIYTLLIYRNGMPYSQVQFLWMDSKYKTNGLKGEIIWLTVA